MKTMGEYECINCNAVFYLEEPPFDGFTLCKDCRDEEEESDETVVKFPQLSEVDKQFEELERQRDLIKEQADLIKTHRTSPSEYP